MRQKTPLTRLQNVSDNTAFVGVLSHELVDAGSRWRVGRHCREERSWHVLEFWYLIVYICQ